ncbi:hypothetical protein R1sor_002877 [Riccia sorocarpa]|uniref:RING-type E3 ubiquitin transferase n=1 Tax=Riccia sorocarpa TaxID=122646 RepID=A0ABD3GZZ6_9MARC
MISQACHVYHNVFGPEGGYLPGSCNHPVHIACLLKLMMNQLSCSVCRAPYHKRMWYQFAYEKHLQAAEAFSTPAYHEYLAAYNHRWSLARRLELVDRYEETAGRDFADRHLVVKFHNSYACIWLRTASRSQALRRHGEPAQPRLVELSDDEAD